MKIKTSDGEAHVASQGQATLNTVLGSIGTAGSLGILSGLIGNGRNGNGGGRDSGDRPVTRYEMSLIRESLAKDNEITLLKANAYTDHAMAGVQQQFSMQQTWNALQQANIDTMKQQLKEITKVVVPITSIDPVPAAAGTATQTTQQTGNNGQ